MAAGHRLVSAEVDLTILQGHGLQLQRIALEPQYKATPDLQRIANLLLTRHASLLETADSVHAYLHGWLPCAAQRAARMQALAKLTREGSCSGGAGRPPTTDTG